MKSGAVGNVVSEEFPPAGLGPLTPFEELEAARSRLARAREALAAAESEWMRQREGYNKALRACGYPA